MATVDVTIYGAGAFGLAVGYACASRGAKVRVIDPNGVASGSSGGLVGALAPHVPENWNTKKAFQFDSLIMAETFWADVERVSGESCGYLRSGRVQPLVDDRAVALAQARAVTAADLWQGKAEWSVLPVDQFGAWAPKSETGLVVFDTLTARIHPRRATRALAAGIIAMGGEVVSEAKPEGQVVYATGWRGMVELSEQLGKSVGGGVKGQAALLRYDAADLPQLFADSLHIVPHADGTVAIGSTSEREFESPDAVDHQIEDVIARAIDAFPVLEGAQVIERWAGVRPRAKSRAPMMGLHPVVDGAFVANGGFKIGFGMAPKVGAVMADLILEGIDHIPDGFRPEDSL
ncbi:NAD(P)/FAD-dependent oxidoreductase [Marivivens donghaensis]|uniref:NAD(P)/FAD-dependent oxidoreductase n=1 Tax=Marivivens donghaensis TaxID=1699413 RepID=UPI00201F9948|nr:FAD-binding oxidoreductase [Marivivens donghaensis]MCL7408746.1 FAD-binding oxidoreductase [Marivivens donghaensis]MDN3703211.1 FAD-binding oxidoreductase [Marivivens donghaensis]